MDSDANRLVTQTEFVAYFMIHECEQVMKAEEEAVQKKDWPTKTSEPGLTTPESTFIADAKRVQMI